jgi:hypothetical protein
VHRSHQRRRRASVLPVDWAWLARGAALLLVHSSPGEIFRFSGLDLAPLATAVYDRADRVRHGVLGLEIVSLLWVHAWRVHNPRRVQPQRRASALGRGDFSTRVQVPSRTSWGSSRTRSIRWPRTRRGPARDAGA